ncbi:hypothetical protein D3C86_2151560 [compost metagenome]
MAKPTKTIPKNTKKMGAPILAALMVQKIPNNPTATLPTAPIADGPRPGLMLFI